MAILQANGATKIGNAVIPQEGPLAIPLQMNFATTTAYSLDVGSLMQKGPGYPGLSVIQTLFVDNSAGGSATTVLITGTQQKIIVPAGAQGYFPILSPSTGQIVFQNNSMGVVNADIINVPMPAMIWGGSLTFTPQFDENGRLITTDPALDALISDDALQVMGYDGPIPEAPKDGNTYGRNNGAWEQVQGGGGGGSATTIGYYNPTGFTNFGGGNYLQGRVLCTDNISISKICYVSNQATADSNLIPCCYADNDLQNTGALLAQGPSVANTVQGINNLPLEAALDMVAGTWYWIGFMVTGNGIAIGQSNLGNCGYTGTGGADAPAANGPNTGVGDGYGVWGHV